MKIRIKQNNMLSSSEELLSLSKIIRQSGDKIEEVLRNLRCLSELDQCKYELKSQKESLEQMTGRMVMLAASLREIANVYSMTESRNVSDLEKLSSSVERKVEGSLYSGADIHSRVQNILKR